jgi:hypothetical protein
MGAMLLFMGGHRSLLMVMVWVWVQIRRKMLGSALGILSLSYTFELGDHNELAYLHVDNNRLTGMVPLELGQMQKL